ncbi:MAG TPA: hypothetical protein VNC50_14880, partial [Planctomycetia bacterium]|nr:hypothetical protein [Planctomycetia bacterium]
MVRTTRRRLLSVGLVAMVTGGCVGFRDVDCETYKPLAANEVAIVSSGGKTLVGASEIQAYDWSTHTVHLKPGLGPRVHKRLRAACNGEGDGEFGIASVRSNACTVVIGSESAICGFLYDATSSTRQTFGGGSGAVYL